MGSQLGVQAFGMVAPLRSEVSHAFQPGCPSRANAVEEGVANLPVGAKLGKLLLYGCLFRCIEPILTIAAAMSCKNPFVSNVTTRKEAKLQKLQFLQGSSDLLTIARAYEAWSSVPKSDHRQRRDLCRDYFLSETSLRMISEMRKQFRKQRSGLL